jgi:predicted kinase
MLIVLGGLPGTGKTTIARQVAKRCQTVYLRVDVIEQAIRNAGVLAGDVGPAGYMGAYALAGPIWNWGRASLRTASIR